MSFILPATIPTTIGLQSALDAKAALSGADFTGAVSVGGGTSEFSGLGLGTAYSQRLNATWVNPATTFTALEVNVTDATSAAGSLLANFKVGGVSKFSVDKSGALALTGSVSIGGGVVTVSNPIQIGSQTWNNAAVAFSGLVYNFTDTASAAASQLMDLKVGGVSKFSVRKDGELATPSVNCTGNVRSQYKLWCSGSNPQVSFGDAQDVALMRYAAAVLEVTNGTSGQRRDLMLRALWDAGGNQVVSARQAAVADATDAASVITQLTSLLAKLRTHGLIAT